jgi:hypothetical protein
MAGAPTDHADCYPSWRGLVVGRDVRGDTDLGTFVLSPTGLNLYIGHQARPLPAHNGKGIEQLLSELRQLPPTSGRARATVGFEVTLSAP